MIDHDLVKGVLGRFLEITWTFTKAAQSSAVSNTKLHLDISPLYFAKGKLAKSNGFVPKNCNITL